MLRIFLTGFAAVLLAGCMGGTMQGVTSDGKPVVMQYEQNMMSDTYTATVGGEDFKGTAVMVDDRTTFETAFGSAYSSYDSAVGSSFSGSYSGSGKARAILIGSKGSSLRCLMQYADNTGFTSAGGIGDCVHSDGRTLVVQW